MRLFEENSLQQTSHPRWLVACATVVLVMLAGCERLGFETEEAPKTPTSDTEATTEPEPWEEPPSDWESPTTDLLVYDSTDDAEPTDADAGEQKPSEAEPLEVSDTYHARIVVGEDAIIMENISALKVRTPQERETMAARAERAGLDTIWQSERLEYVDGDVASADRDGVFKLPAVEAFVQTLGELLDEDATAAPTIALDLHRASPYSRIYSVAYSVWNASPGAEFIVRARRDTSDGPTIALVRATSPPENLGECDPSKKPCAGPFVEVRDQGLQVRAAPGIPADLEAGDESNTDDADAGDGRETSLPCLPGQESASEGELPRFETDDDWTNRVMLLDEALCPSVPSHDDGSYDAAGLVELFNDIEAMAPGGTRMSWTAGMEASWESFGQVIGHAAAQTSFVEIAFERPLPRTTPDPTCDDGLRPAPDSER